MKTEIDQIQDSETEDNQNSPAVLIKRSKATKEAQGSVIKRKEKRQSAAGIEGFRFHDRGTAIKRYVKLDDEKMQRSKSAMDTYLENFTNRKPKFRTSDQKSGQTPSKRKEAFRINHEKPLYS